MALSDSESKEMHIEDVKGSDLSAANVVLEVPEQLPSFNIEATSKFAKEIPAEFEEKPTKKGVKRRASEAFSDENDEDFKGFVNTKQNDAASECSAINQLLGRIEEEKTALSKDLVSIKTVTIKPVAVRAVKRTRKDTDGSRPSSGLSSKSEADTILSENARITSPASVNRDMSSPQFLLPIEKGWRRELVYRAVFDQHSRRPCDIYYYTPQGKKLRSSKEIGDYLAQNRGTGLSTENFTFFKEPLGLNDPEKEIIRDAKFVQRTESPLTSPAQFTPRVEGKRTPKPKLPKGATLEPLRSPPAKIKVKSLGSRLSANSPVTTPKPKKPITENNKSEAWKKPSEDRRVTRTKLTNGSVTSPIVTPSVQITPKRRGKAKADDTDRFFVFYNKSKENKDSKYNVLEQVFQYLGMRDLAHCARVCKLWKELAAMPTLWRHVRMKNSHVSDWNGLCTALKRHATKRLDLRKMLLPQNDTNFWELFAKQIGTVNTLERIEMCRCPASAVEALCKSLPKLKSLSALAIRDTTFDPTPLGRLSNLEELRLKSMSGLSLSSDLTPLSKLKNLQHLSLTSIKELGWCACDVVGGLSNLESLELGECTFRAEFGSVLAKLSRLKRLRLERGTSPCSTPAILKSLSNLPLLTRLELVNVDVKVGFDDALSECKNIQRLLIIPTYVSQSATTNKQVLSGILRLKDTLTHLMWGVTIELLRVTELFIDQCEQGDAKKKDIGECIPVLKPVPGCKLPEEHTNIQGPPQVEILPLPTLQRLLSAQLPNTKVKLLRIPFHATWRQTLSDFQ